MSQYTPPEKLLNKNLFLLWQGQFISLLGSQAFNIAMMFWVKQTTGSATLMGLLMMSASLPAVILSPLGGVFADRYSRKKIMIISDTLDGLAIISLAIFMYWAPNAPWLIGYLFFVAILLGCSGAFFRPAINAALPDIVPKAQLPAANALAASTVQIAQLCGNVIGGILFRVLGAPLMFLIDGLSYLFSACTELFIQLPEPKKQEKTDNHWFKQFVTESREGLQYLTDKQGMKEFFVLAGLVNFLITPCIILLPFYVEDFLQATTDWYGFIIAAYGAGALVGYALAGIFKVTATRRIVPMTLAFTMMALLICTAGFTTDKVTALGIMTLIGICNGYVNVNILTILQASTEENLRGRVFGLLGTLTGSVMPLAMGLSGIVFDLVGRNISLIFVASGSLLLITAITISLRKNYRAFIAYDLTTSTQEVTTKT
jgi:MFS transporter, DHA3 family, macrolide efflux protein